LQRNLLKYFLGSLFCFTLVSGAYDPTDPIKTGKTVRLLIGGDVSFGEHKQDEGKHDILTTKGYYYSTEFLKPFSKKIDYGIVNLETTLCIGIESPYKGRKGQIHWNSPIKVPEVLESLHINAVSLANNHTYDYGIPGLKQTFAALDEKHILYFGAGMNKDLAREPLVQTFTDGKNDLELYVITGYWHTEAYEKRYSFYAEKDKAGVGRYWRKRTLNLIEEIKRTKQNSYVIVFPHGGANYSWHDDKQKLMARSAIDAGADLYIGHGSHMMQEFEFYKDKWIIYNLGNYLFNTPGRYEAKAPHSYSSLALLNIDLSTGRLAEPIHLYPFQSNNRKTNYQPRPVEEEEFKELFFLLRGRGDYQTFLNVSQEQDKLGHFFSLKPGA
jgi:poly-gamma-glutamate capsule biosynthesis protein CapA/YwtB (metallophosphatase superfamily)